MTAGCTLVPRPPNSPDRPSPASPTAVQPTAGQPTTGQPTAEQPGADFDDLVATERLPDGLAAQELRIMRDGAALNLESTTGSVAGFRPPRSRSCGRCWNRPD